MVVRAVLRAKNYVSEWHTTAKYDDPNTGVVSSMCTLKTDHVKIPSLPPERVLSATTSSTKQAKANPKAAHGPPPTPTLTSTAYHNIKQQLVPLYYSLE
eukprot:scaffold13020_cov118-Skeletonema_dohrnii-CCMP3373.AAC.5